MKLSIKLLSPDSPVPKQAKKRTLEVRRSLNLLLSFPSGTILTYDDLKSLFGLRKPSDMIRVAIEDGYLRGYGYREYERL